MRTETLLLTGLCLLASPLAAQDPLSAIDWLHSAPRGLTAMPQQMPPPRSEPPVAATGTVPAVDSAPLDAPSQDAAGLLPMSVTGLPRSLWSRSDGPVLIPLLGAVDPVVPALAAQLLTLLLAEADAPRGSGGAGASFLAARLDRLMQEGAVDAALALVDQAGGAGDPQIFARWRDLALIAGEPDAPCAALRRNPHLSDDLPTRIFCEARGGSWDHAVTIFGSARALGQIDAREADLLARFLDPDLIEGAEPVPPPARPTPLEFRLFETIGEALPTQPLPRAFAAADLGGTSGWRAQILAAERLARRGTVSENRLLGIYTDRAPAASGGVWDRVAAVQALDRALAQNRTEEVAPALLAVWPQMRSAGLLVPFAQLFADRLDGLPLEGRAADLVPRARLLADGYETAAAGMDPAPGLLHDAAAIARGRAPDSPPQTAQRLAIAAAWAEDSLPPEPLATQLREGRLGEVILRAMALFASGAEGNHADLTDALATFRAMGLEDTARRAAIQLMILSDEGAPL